MMKYICIFDRPGSGDICAGKTFGGKKEESRWGAIVGEGVMDDPRIGGTHRLQDTNTKIYRYTNIKLYRYTNTKIYRYTKIMIDRYTNIKLYRYTNIKIY